jgi:hypothetical protein
MTKNIAEIDTLTDTFNTWVLRTNEIIETVGTEVLTANSTTGFTGTSGSPRNARLFGTFTATSLIANNFSITSAVSGNSTSLGIESGIRLVANNSAGSAGQVLTSNGAGVYWSTVTSGGGGGGVTALTAGNGIEFTPGSTITSTGSIRAKAGDNSIVVNSSGISVNTAFLTAGLTNATTLLDRTWASPAAIGSTTANTGNFTTVTAAATNGYRLSGDINFRIDNTVIRSSGLLDVTTPNDATTGGVRIRSNGTSGFAYLQITNTAGNVEWGNFRFNSNGDARYSRDFEVAGNLRFAAGFHSAGAFPGTEVGYKSIPQIITNSNITPIDYVVSSGAHHYKTSGSEVSITFNTNATTPIGTAITFVNDASTGNLLLIQGSGVMLQLGGTLTASNRTVGPGGIATALCVAANKWIVSGTGVL